MKALMLLATLALPLSAQTGRTFTYDCIGEAKLTLADTLVNLRVKKDTTRVSATPCITRTKRDSVPATPPPVVTPTPVPPSTTLPLVTELGPVLPLTGGFRVAYDVASVTSTLDPTGLPSLAMRFPAGYTGGSSPATVYREGFSVSTIRWEQVVIFPTNYQQHPNMDKSVFIQVNEQNTMFTYFSGAGMTPNIGLQQQVVSGSYNIYASPAVTMTRGVRHTLACEAVGNTAGQNNGTIDCWLDGVKIIQGRNIGFDARGAKFTGVAWSPIWGGAGGTITTTQYSYLASLKVWGR